MTLREQLAQASSAMSRAAIFRGALLERGTNPNKVARACRTSHATVSNVLIGKTVGGVKARKVQDYIADLLGEDPDLLFPDRGPPTKGGGFHAHRKNWKPG